MSYENENYNVISVEKNQLISLQDVKDYLRICDDHDDKILLNLLEAAILHAENFTGVSFREKCIELRIAKCPSLVYLRYFPILSESECSVFMATSPKDKVSNDHYKVSLNQGKIMFSSALSNKEVIVTYKAGYQSDTCPADVKNAILMYAGNLYDHHSISSQALFAINNIYMRYRSPKV